MDTSAPPSRCHTCTALFVHPYRKALPKLSCCGSGRCPECHTFHRLDQHQGELIMPLSDHDAATWDAVNAKADTEHALACAAPTPEPGKRYHWHHHSDILDETYDWDGTAQYVYTNGYTLIIWDATRSSVVPNHELTPI